MATEVDAAAVSCYGGDNWSCPKLHRDGEESQGKAFCISKLVDHRSISFGRYEAENLAWEKFSIFSPNRRKEEVEKSTAPGLVAQKKAFFEEYFKGFRAMKGLFKGQKVGEAAVPAGNLHSGQDSKAEKGNAIDTVRGTKLNRSSYSPNTKDANKAEQRKKHSPAKGSVASAASMLKPGSKMKKDDVKKSVGLLKPSVTKTVTKKPVKEVIPTKSSVKSSTSNHRKLGEGHNAVREVQAKTAREKTVAPPKTKKSSGKPDTTSTKVVTQKLPVSTQTAKTITTTGHTRGSSLANRNLNEVGKKPLTSSGISIKQKSGEPENQKPKAMSTKLPVSNASKPGARTMKSASGEKPEKATNARIGRDPKPAPSKVTDIRTTPNVNTVRKSSSSRVGLTNELKDPKDRVPKRR
ncbi:Protein WVD2-like 7 [Linum grandiflorum]